LPTIYDLKPRFQALLRPACAWLVGAGATANVVTIAALLLSLAQGSCIALAPQSRWPLLVLPVTLILRMALNALDGMMAREHGQASPAGAVLNELSDVIATPRFICPSRSFPASARRSSVPVFMHGLGKALPKGSALLVLFNARVNVGEPLYGKASYTAFVAELEARMTALGAEERIPAWERPLNVHQNLEPAIDHALHVEGHGGALHHLGEALVLHHLGVDAVAVGARLEHDPRQDDRLVGIELDAARERGELAHFHVVGNTFKELERAVLAPDLARLARHLAIGGETLLGHRHDKSIDIGHGELLYYGQAPS
jgi:hypothetical protein